MVWDSIDFDQVEFKNDGFDVHRFDRDGYNTEDSNRSKPLIDNEGKVKKSVVINPWTLFYAKGKHDDCDELLKKCFLLKRKIYQYAIMLLKSSIEFTLSFLRQGGSFSLIGSYLRDERKIALNAVEVNPKSFQCLSRYLRHDANLFELAIEIKKDRKIRK